VNCVNKVLSLRKSYIANLADSLLVVSMHTRCLVAAVCDFRRGRYLQMKTIFFLWKHLRRLLLMLLKSLLPLVTIINYFYLFSLILCVPLHPRRSSFIAGHCLLWSCLCYRYIVLSVVCDACIVAKWYISLERCLNK